MEKIEEQSEFREVPDLARREGHEKFKLCDVPDGPASLRFVALALHCGVSAVDPKLLRADAVVFGVVRDFSQTHCLEQRRDINAKSATETLLEAVPAANWIRF